MAVAVVHATTAAGPNDPAKQVSSDAWNAAHTITGLATVAGTGAYADLTGKPTLGTAAAAATTDFLAAGGTAANASQLLTKTWAAPDPIGSGTPNTGAFTSFTATLTGSFTGQILAGTGTQAAPSLAWTAETTLGFWRSAAQTITFSSNTSTAPTLKFLGSDGRTGSIQTGPSSGLYMVGQLLGLLGAGGNGAPRIAAYSANAATFYWQLFDDNVQDTLALRRGVNAQTYRVYGTYTDTSNYGRASLACSATDVTLAAESAGTGPANMNLILTPKGTGTVQVPTVAAGTSSVAAASTAYAVAAAPNSSYRVILDSSGSLTAASVAGTYGFGQGIPVQITGTGTAAPANTIYIAAADFPTVNGLTTKLRVRAQVFCNDVAPGVTFTFGLHPITRPATSGGVGLVIYTIGTAVASSTAAIATPAADSSNVNASADFAIPADGHYVLGVVTSGGALAASSHVHMSVCLQLRNT